MNNEQNKPVELTEKELAGIAGGEVQGSKMMPKWLMTLVINKPVVIDFQREMDFQPIALS